MIYNDTDDASSTASFSATIILENDKDKEIIINILTTTIMKRENENIQHSSNYVKKRYVYC